MDKIIRDLYQDLQAHVIHDGQLSSKFPTSQGSGQGRILAPSMYKVYINSLIRKICDLKVGNCLTNRFCSDPTFDEDMTLLDFMLQPCQLLSGVPMIIAVSGGMNIIMRKVEL